VSIGNSKFDKSAQRKLQSCFARTTKYMGQDWQFGIMSEPIMDSSIPHLPPKPPPPTPKKKHQYTFLLATRIFSQFIFFSSRDFKISASRKHLTFLEQPVKVNLSYRTPTYWNKNYKERYGSQLTLSRGPHHIENSKYIISNRKLDCHIPKCHHLRNLQVGL
jgi:hypothetical protein